MKKKKTTNEINSNYDNFSEINEIWNYQKGNKTDEHEMQFFEQKKNTEILKASLYNFDEVICDKKKINHSHRIHGYETKILKKKQ